MTAWQTLMLAHDRTHHVDPARQPVYAERFDEVLKFHAPGLAPVRRGSAAWHIDASGTAAYARRFRRTFGYYEGLAVVVDDDGWHHIDSSGQSLYPDRYAWCGNFQEGRCSVRGLDERYFHIAADGGAAYGSRWRYAGDFRDGLAVVQSDDGLSTHIDRDGQMLHGRWFLDLDVFHKGFARARDEGGWTHVDCSGEAVYARRFAAVEPFYNGHARVERFDGGLEVIGESGERIVELRPARRSEFHALSGDLVGFWRTETLAAGVAVGVFEALPATANELATQCQLTTEGARRLLDALGELGVVSTDGDRWQVTERGQFLTAGHPLTLATAALEYRGPLAERWRNLEALLRGAQGLPRESIFAQVARVSQRREGFHRMLASYARHDYPSLVPQMPIRPGDVVIDAGGGTGALGVQIASHYPEAEVVVGDLPEIMAGLKLAGVRTIGFDFFEPWPLTVDVIVLARVLHDWDDRDALRILRRAVAALNPGGRLVIVEFLRPDEGLSGALCDLHLLAVTGGRERRQTEWIGLLAEAGLETQQIVRGEGVPSMLVAMRSEPRAGGAS